MLQISIDDYPALDGSTSTGPVLAMIGCHFMEVPCRWVECIDGERVLLPELTDATDQFPGFQVSGTHQAYLNLIDGEVDLILAAREPSEDEILYAAKAGALLENVSVALDAFVFIVNDENPIVGINKYPKTLKNGSLLG
jgi:phosphate transport system substrate-binding protein